MTKDEKILQKVGKLLLKFGVAEEEKEEFISQLSAMKEDDEEPTEPTEPDGEPAKEGEEPEEVQKTIEGLVARIDAQDKQIIDLQEIVAKLGDPKENGFGTSPSNPSGGSAEQSEFDRINRARLGR